MKKMFKRKKSAIIAAGLALLLVSGTAMAINSLHSPVVVTVEPSDDGTAAVVAVSLEGDAEETSVLGVEVYVDKNGEVSYSIIEDQNLADCKVREAIELLLEEFGDDVDVMVQSTMDENGIIVLEYSLDGGNTWNLRAVE